MGEIIRAFKNLEGGAELFEQIVQWTLKDPDVAVTLAALMHFASENSTGIPGSAKARDIGEAVQGIYLEVFEPLGVKAPVINAQILTSFKHGHRPEPRWHSLPALFWIWLCEQREEGSFRDSVIDELLRSSSLCERLAKRLPTNGPTPPRSTNYAFFYGGHNDLEYTREELTLILSRLRHEIGNNPRRPEYPMMNRRFPATPTYEIVADGHSVLLKDESARGTGTHKERMAHEVLVEYAQRHIPEALNKTGEKFYLPRYSMISTGSAAVALQIQLDRYRLPNLHVIVDEKRTPKKVMEHLRIWGAVLFEIDLDKDLLSRDDVLRITHNQNDGSEDLTIREFDEHSDRKFYDWLSFEILNLKPKHVFVPVGTGELFASLVYTMLSDDADERLCVDREDIAGVTIWGAKTEQSTSNMTMLYAKHRPSLRGMDDAIARAVEAGVIGADSKIHDISDNYARRAVQIIEDYGVKRTGFNPHFSIRTSESGAAGLALFLRESGKLKGEGPVVVVNTGALDLL